MPTGGFLKHIDIYAALSQQPCQVTWLFFFMAYYHCDGVGMTMEPITNKEKYHENQCQ